MTSTSFLNSTCLDLPFPLPLLLVVDVGVMLGIDAAVETLRVRRRVAGGERVVLVGGAVDVGDDRAEERLLGN